MRPSIALLVASMLLTGLPPSAGMQEAQDLKPALTKADRAAAKKIQRQMEGVWKLTEMRMLAEDLRVSEDLEIQKIGYAVVHGQYLSLEFHMRLVDKLEADYGQSLVSGLHRIELDGIGSMKTTSVIATRTRRDGSLEFEPPGTTRSYDVAFEGEKMTMTRDDGHRLEFERMEDDSRRRFDIFGRPVRDEDEKVEDVEKEEVGPDGGQRRKN
ncbi:MAG: hypothetical protein ACKVXR_17525 [Planctomycetota bacterium]